MLSYAKHGKFPALTQAAQAESRRKKRPFRPNDVALPLFRARSGSWDGTDCKCAASDGEWPDRHHAGAALRPLKKRRRNGSRSPYARIFAQVQPLGLRQMNFASDNTAPVAPAILDALTEASRGYARGYGNDDWTKAAERRFCDIFERDVAAFLVPTGTAANALALAQVSPPWGAVLCHAESHILTDECGAPEFFGNGLKLVGLAGAAGKITAEGPPAALGIARRRLSYCASQFCGRGSGLLRVKGGHGVDLSGASLGPSIAAVAIAPQNLSALCQLQTHAAQQISALFDHLVGASEQRWRQIESDGVRCLQVDDEFEPVRLLDRELGRIGALEDAIHM